MYELDYPDYVSSLHDGIKNPTQTISIGDSLSYEKFTNEYLKTLNKDRLAAAMRYVPVCTSTYKYVLVCTVKYLYSTATLYSNSSDGVNLFFSSSSKSRKKPPSKASACVMHPAVLSTGTGRPRLRKGGAASVLCRLGNPSSRAGSCERREGGPAGWIQSPGTTSPTA